MHGIGRVLLQDYFRLYSTFSDTFKRRRFGYPGTYSVSEKPVLPFRVKLLTFRVKDTLTALLIFLADKIYIAPKMFWPMFRSETSWSTKSMHKTSSLTCKSIMVNPCQAFMHETHGLSLLRNRERIGIHISLSRLRGYGSTVWKYQLLLGTLDVEWNKLRPQRFSEAHWDSIPFARSFSIKKKRIQKTHKRSHTNIRR